MPESDNYDVLEKIGHGSFGVIRKVRRKADGMIACRKEISYLKMSQKEREQLHSEFQILSTLRHENIVGYFHREHLKSSQDLYLYMEYCGNGDLGRVIRDLKHRNQLAEEVFVWSIFSQLLTALFRCHYGVDPPEVGKNVLGLGPAAKPVTPPGCMTILHRDLKPENVFLGEGNSVKLGDFGLAKMIQSHDFASTYVGTPFYMSPEICQAEKYTLKSDIWSLGCIIYELCSREPPFNAKTHFQLVQKIKEGKVAPLPPVYSPELFAVIKDCLRVNPDKRPDTASLLNLPAVRLMRKEKEVVDMNRLVRAKEEALNARAREWEQKVDAMQREIDATLHREWEVKARLEIDRVVGMELKRLQKTFEQEVQARVAAELQSRRRPGAFPREEGGSGNELSSSSQSKTTDERSSVGEGSADGKLSLRTDLTESLTEVSLNSPDTSFTGLNGNEPKKVSRTPFGRAQTMFAGTPMDVEMASPSPIAIASLSLSPRRNAAAKAPNANPGNIFAIPSAITEDPRWAPTGRDPSGSSSGGSPSDWDSDDDNTVPSPTRMIRSSKNPFKRGDAPPLKARPGLMHQKSAPNTKPKPPHHPALVPLGKPVGGDGLRAANSGGVLREQRGSPNRRLSKIPSAANLVAGNSTDSSCALGRKPSVKDHATGSTGPADGSSGNNAPAAVGHGLVSKKVAGAGGGNNIKGRTLVELQQARAGGRPLSAMFGAESNLSPKKAGKLSNGRPGSALEPAAVWDPEMDEMPSPFLVRRKPVSRT